MKFLLLGASGQVGTELRRRLPALGAVTCATRTGMLDDGSPCLPIDLDSPRTLASLVDSVVPDVVVNAAAYTAVDRAEDDAAAAFRANAEAPGVLAHACATRGAWLVHYSTDYVFDGQGRRPYREDDPVAPLGVYGASKLAGEQAIQASGARHLIFRTAWVYAAHGHNFLRTMLRLSAERDELRVVDDQVGSPTPASLIADVTARVVGAQSGESGLWHLTAAGTTSWAGFASAIVDGAVERGLIPRAPRVVPIRSEDYPTRARRPAYSVLDTARLARDFGIRSVSWQDGLGSVLDQSGIA
jgi:dTDP-4-dehydrorhamnose reductase